MTALLQLVPFPSHLCFPWPSSPRFYNNILSTPSIKLHALHTNINKYIYYKYKRRVKLAPSVLIFYAYSRFSQQINKSILHSIFSCDSMKSSGFFFFCFFSVLCLHFYFFFLYSYAQETMLFQWCIVVTVAQLYIFLRRQEIPAVLHAIYYAFFFLNLVY